MKTSRLAAYAAAGVILGLLFENGIMKMKEQAACEAKNLKKKAGKMAEKVAQELQ